MRKIEGTRLSFMHTEPQLERLCAPDQRTRRHARHRVRVFVRVFTPSGEMLEGLSNDVSEGGMSVFVSCRFEIGQHVRLEFRIPTSLESVNLDALVRDCNGFRHGVEFRDLGATDEQVLRKSCEELTALLSVQSSAQSASAI